MVPNAQRKLRCYLGFPQGLVPVPQLKFDSFSRRQNLCKIGVWIHEKVIIVKGEGLSNIIDLQKTQARSRWSFGKKYTVMLVDVSYEA